MQYGYWKVRVIQKHRLPASLRHLVPGGFVGAVLLLLIFGIFFPSARFGLAILLGAYVGGNLLASGVTAARSGWRYFPILPAVIACFQIGYGVGFLRGLIDFLVLRRGPSVAYTRLTRESKSMPSLYGE